MKPGYSPTDWLQVLAPDLREIASLLRDVVLKAAPDLDETIKWGNLVYQRKGLVCYLAATKGYISLGFFKGASLADPEGVLEGKSKKLRHIKVGNLEHAELHRYAAWVREAAALNQ